MTSSDKPKTAGLSREWQEVKDWEEIQHLASTALKMLANPSTKDLAMSLATRVEIYTRHLKTLAPTAKENKSNE